MMPIFSTGWYISKCFLFFKTEMLHDMRFKIFISDRLWKGSFAHWTGTFVYFCCCCSISQLFVYIILGPLLRGRVIESKIHHWTWNNYMIFIAFLLHFLLQFYWILPFPKVRSLSMDASSSAESCCLHLEQVSLASVESCSVIYFSKIEKKYLFFLNSR